MACDHRYLREMHVGVDEARRDQRVLAIIPDLRARRQQGRDAGGRAKMRDTPVLHGHDRIGLMDHRPIETIAERIARIGEDRSAYGRRSGRRRHRRDVRTER